MMVSPSLLEMPTTNAQMGIAALSLDAANPLVGDTLWTRRAVFETALQIYFGYSKVRVTDVRATAPNLCGEAIPARNNASFILDFTAFGESSFSIRLDGDMATEIQMAANAADVGIQVLTACINSLTWEEHTPPRNSVSLSGGNAVLVPKPPGHAGLRKGFSVASVLQLAALAVGVTVLALMAVEAFRLRQYNYHGLQPDTPSATSAPRSSDGVAEELEASLEPASPAGKSGYLQLSPLKKTQAVASPAMTRTPMSAPWGSDPPSPASWEDLTPRPVKLAEAHYQYL